MAFTGASLGDGQVATTWANILAPSGAKWVVKSLDMQSTNAATQTLELRITRSGSSARVWKRAELDQNELVEFLADGEVLVLSDGDVLQAQTTTATGVDWTATGQPNENLRRAGQAEDRRGGSVRSYLRYGWRGCTE